MSRLIFLGPPGSGKGTQAQMLANSFGLIKISTGDLLRVAIRDQTLLGLEAKPYYDQGNLVPDPILIGLVREQLRSLACDWILDGFPRTLPQAEALEVMLAELGQPYDLAIALEVPEDELVRRLSHRGEGRSDDSEPVIRHRMKVYAEQTQPLIDFYQSKGSLKCIDGDRPPEIVFAELTRLLQGSESG